MTERRQADSPRSTDESLRVVAWEVPEIAAVVVLVAFFALVVGGLAAGIILSTEVGGPAPRQFTGEAIVFGASWAEPLLAVALLGVVCVGWWQTEAWINEAEGDHYDDAVSVHVERARRIGAGAQVALVLTVFASIAGLIGEVLMNVGTNAGSWSRYMIAGAGLAGVLALAAGGLWIGRRARDARPTDR
jgi:hypothetical protein